MLNLCYNNTIRLKNNRFRAYGERHEDRCIYQGKEYK